MCELAMMTLSIFEIENMVFRQKKGGLPTPGLRRAAALCGGEEGSQISWVLLMSESKVGRETDGWMGAVIALTRTPLLVHNGQKAESEASGQDAILPSPCGDPSAESGHTTETTSPS